MRYLFSLRVLLGLCIISIAGMSMCLTGCVKEDESDPDVVTVCSPVPELEVTTLDGDTFSTLPPLHGEMLIIFFNTECQDCRKELPLIQKYYESTLLLPSDERPQLICISREEDAASVSKYWAEHDFTMPAAAAPGRYPYSLFANSGIPRVYLIKDGIISAISDSIQNIFFDEK